MKFVITQKINKYVSRVQKRYGTEEPGSEESVKKRRRFERFPRINVVNFLGSDNNILYTEAKSVKRRKILINKRKLSSKFAYFTR